MTYEADEVRNEPSGPNQGDSQQPPENPQEIAGDIAHTRAEMGETIDAIEERLQPQRLKEQAKQRMREQTLGKVKQRANQVVSQIRSRAEPLTSKAQQQGQHIVARVRQLQQENPRLLTAAVAGPTVVLATVGTVSMLRSRREKRRRRTVPVVVAYIGTLRRRDRGPRRSA